MVVCRTTLSDPLRCAAVQSPTIRSPLWEKVSKMCSLHNCVQEKKSGGVKKKLKKKHKVALLGPLLGSIWPFEQYKWHIVEKSRNRDKRPKAMACNCLSKSLNILQRPEAEFTSIIFALTGCYMRKQIVFQTNGHRCEDLSPPWLYLSIGTFGKLGTEGGQIPKSYLS